MKAEVVSKVFGHCGQNACAEASAKEQRGLPAANAGNPFITFEYEGRDYFISFVMTICLAFETTSFTV